MQKTAQIVGIVWMTACVALWLYVGFFAPEPGAGSGWMNWTLPRMLADTQLGLTFVPILLAIPGAMLWQWGKRPRA